MVWNTQRRQDRGNSERGAYNLDPAMEAESTAPESLAAASEAAHLTPAFWPQWHRSHREQNSSGSGAYDSICPAAKALATLPPPP